MTYALSFLAFLAVVLATVGNTWHAGRPTKSGWGLIVIAIVVFVATTIRTFCENTEKERIELVACQQVISGTFSLLTPFAILVADASRRGDNDNALEERVLRYLKSNPVSNSSEMAEILSDLPRLNREQDYLKKYKVTDHPSILGGSRVPNWREIFSTTAAKGIEELARTLSSFQSVMDSETITATQELRSIWLTRRVENLPSLKDPLSLQEFLEIGAVSSLGVDFFHFQEFLQAAGSTIRLCSTVETK